MPVPRPSTKPGIILPMIDSARFDHARYGQSVGFNAGTDGMMFVDGVNGDDANDGLTLASAKQTLSAGLTAANSAGGDQVIRLVGDGVKYRESNDFNYNNASLTSLKIAGYGTDRPIISGAEEFNTWVPCVAGDSSVVGSNWASVYKKTVTTADFPAPDYWRTLLTENGEPLIIAGLRVAGRTTPDFFIDNINQCYDSNSLTEVPLADLTFGLRDSVWYDTITHPSLLGSYTDTQLEQTVAVVHAFPNVTGFMEVTSVSSQVLQLETASLRPAGGGTNGAYALLNVLPNIAQGEWGYRDNGDGTTTFYCWPTDAANLTANMELAVRSEGLRMLYNVNNLSFTMEGVNFEMFAGGGFRNQCLGLQANTFTLTGTSGLVKECRFSLYYGGLGSETRFIQQGVEWQNCTWSDGVGFGLQTVPSSPSDAWINDFRVRNCLAQDVSQTGFRMFGIRDALIENVRSVRTSGGGHANAINFYSGCDNVAVINAQMAVEEANRLYEGYGANQSSSRLYFLHCTFTPGSDSRAYVDQNVTDEVLPTVGGGGYLINCWVPHMPDRVGSQDNGGITVGRNIMDWEIYNCVTPAIINTGGTLTRRNNILTNSTSTGDASETLVSVDALHEDVTNFDFSPASGSILNTKAGFDVSSIITTLEAAFPGENFRRDANGAPWDPASPGMGPYGSAWT